MRIDKLQGGLKQEKLDAAFFFSLKEPNVNMKYLAGYPGIGILAVTQRKSFLLVPEMEVEKAKQTRMKIYKAEKKKLLIESLAEILSKEKIRNIAIEEDKCTVRLFKKLKKHITAKYYDISEICAKIRMIKEEKELKYIRYACSVVDDVFSKIRKNFRFRTEQELRDYIEENIKNRGCELSFPPIVASGKGSSVPHYEGNKEIKEGFLLLDFGAKYMGYCSDMTRMLYIGEPKGEEIETYTLVLNAIEKCEKTITEKKRFSELYELVIGMFQDKAENFVHALGHGLGLEIHESPSLYSEDENDIQDNIAFTIEPGLYFEGKYGIRIEDTVVMKNRKLEILTASTKKLVVMKKGKK